MGDALVDVIATCDDDFLTRFALPKGAMQLLDEPQALALYDAMGTAREMSGGSAANSMAGAAAMGADVSFVYEDPPAFHSLQRFYRAVSLD